MRRELLSTKIYKEISIPGIICSDGEEVFIKEYAMMVGKFMIKLTKDKYVLLLGVENLVQPVDEGKITSQQGG